MPLIDTIDKPPEFESTGKRTDNHSWLITINPNKSDYTSEWYKKFKEGMSVLFADGGGGLIDYLRYTWEGKEITNPDMTKLKEISIDGGFEKGSKMGRAHLHVTVNIQSIRGLYAQVDYRKITDHIRQMLPGVHIDIKSLGKDRVKTIQEYTRKGMVKNWPEITIDQTFKDWLGENADINSKYLKKMSKDNKPSLIRQVVNNPNKDKEYLINAIITKNKLEHKSDDILDKIKAIMIADERTTEADIDALLDLLE